MFDNTKPNIIIIADKTDMMSMIKTIGPYKVASELRNAGFEVAVNVVAVPPVVAAVNVIDAASPLAVAVPIVGLSGKSAIGVMPGINVLLFTLAKIVIFLYAYPN
jgi:hypothetical protein